MLVMFIFFLIAGCAWLARGIVYARRCRAENVPLKEAVRTAWSTPCLPMPDTWVPVRDTVMQYVELAVLVGTLLNKLIYVSMIENATFLNFLVGESFYWPVLLAFTLLLAKCTIRERVFLAALEVGLYFFGEGAILTLLLLVLFAADFGLKKTMKVYMILLGFFLVMTTVLSGLGVIESGNMTDAETRGTESAWFSVRYAFGIDHPNAAGILVAVWVVMWFMLRCAKLTWRDWVLALVAGVLIAVVIDSRGALLFFAAFLFLFAVLRKWPRLLDKKVLQGIAVLSPVLCAALSYFTARFYDPDSKIWNLPNKLSTGRLGLFHEAYQNSTLSLRGRPVSELKVFCLDNAYLSILWEKGIILFVLLGIAYVLLIRYLWKKKAVPELAVTLAFMAYFCVENTALKIIFNISLLLFGSMLLSQSGQKQALFSKAPEPVPQAEREKN